jgi:molybdate transport system substrate-binding protein
VVADTTMQTAQLASTGTAQGGIFAYSLVFDPQIKGKGKFVLLPEYLHSPIRHRMVLLKNASSTAKDFYDYLQSAPARVIFSEYSFSFVLFRRVDED